MGIRLRSTGLALGTLSSLAAAQAAPLDTRVADRCRIAAFGRDTDPQGSTLRAGPGIGAPPLGRLPPMKRDAGTLTVAPAFDVIGGRDGWFLVRNVSRPTYAEGGKDASFPNLRGWIAAGLADVQIGSATLTAAPRRGAPTVLALAGPSWGPDSVRVVRVFRCSGSYAEVAIRTPDGRHARGWASGLCNNQVSTCDGGVVSWEDRSGRLVDPND